ncbi:hypothetical protein CHLNCDRAFT_139206 [Chlorella variabilis]|uniref:Methyltransferase domain-containing protein n=1 Tax=Chlorella variabilis TaxID=554065 RepID=E1ZPG7_CHLVA|nr:hypothetical protein CHLNCDRAFT_139206 [Chlorella variabilis]EFN52275.1 hypothetical protein CHLNCDRAFT_139206 [Chlorella variabilis]|eukprot:XP_005844377.1 hypothetical protein CHLNCDRAFT_139206 [Chlorella variabilis]
MLTRLKGAAGRCRLRVTLPVALLLAAVALLGLSHHSLQGGGTLFLAVSQQRGVVRRLSQDTQWHRNGSDALATWRSSLLKRMLKLYKATEAAAYYGRSSNTVRRARGQDACLEGRERQRQRMEPAGFHRFALFNPIVRCPDGQLPRRLGDDGDGGKWLCQVAGSGGGRPGHTCVVYSVGSNRQVDFEIAMLKEGCEVHTFDCNSHGQSIYQGRHFFHHLCLGNTNGVRDEQKRFVRLDAAMAMNGHPRVDVLKMDIEGFEFEVLSGFQWLKSCGFPTQISLEVHWNHLYQMTPFHRNPDSWGHLIWPLHRLSLAELAVVFFHLADLGFALVSREDNPLSVQGCCSEFTLIRVEQPAHCHQ